MSGNAGRFQGKRAVVTGACSGLGRGAAMGLLQEGAKLVFVDHNLEEGQRMEQEYGMPFLHCDVRQVQAIRDTFRKIGEHFGGGLDILVNSAGIADHTLVYDIEEETWDSLIDTNLKGTFFCAQAAAKLMRETGTLSFIVNLASVLAERADGRHTIYCASKAGVQAVTRSLAIALATDDIHVNAVAPAYVRTNMTEHNLSNPKWMEALRARVPKGRMIELDEVTRTILFFCSEESSGITGQNLYIDEGWTVNM